MTVAIQVDLRKHLGPARDQGPRPTCLIFAVSDTHAAHRKSPWEPLSVEYLFFCAKRLDQYPPSGGTTVSAVRVALEHEGQPVEASWPYLANLPPDHSAWKPPSSIGPVFKRRSNQLGSGFHDVWAHVEGGTMVIIAMALSAAFYSPGPSGMVEAGEPPDHSVRHAVVAVGIGSSGSSRFVLIRNSWGPAWGHQGHAWLSEAYLTPRLLSVFCLE